MDERDILKEIKQIDNNIADVIIPVFKDTIEDYRKIVFKLIAVIVILIISLAAISGYAIHKYNDFLSQFEFSTEYVQDFDTGENGDIIDAKIENSK